MSIDEQEGHFGTENQQQSLGTCPERHNWKRIYQDDEIGGSTNAVHERGYV